MSLLFFSTVLLGSAQDADSSAMAPMNGALTTSQGFGDEDFLNPGGRQAQMSATIHALLPATDGLGVDGQVIPASSDRFGTGNFCRDMNGGMWFGGTVIINARLSMGSTCMDTGVNAFWDHKLIEVIFDKQKCWKFCRGKTALMWYDRSCTRWCEPTGVAGAAGGSKPKLGIGLTIAPDAFKSSEHREIYMPGSSESAMAKRESAVQAFAAAEAAARVEEMQSSGGVNPREGPMVAALETPPTPTPPADDDEPAAAPAPPPKTFKFDPSNMETTRGTGTGAWCRDDAMDLWYPDGEVVENKFLCRRNTCENGVWSPKRTCTLVSWRQCWAKCAGQEISETCVNNYCRRVKPIASHPIFQATNSKQARSSSAKDTSPRLGSGRRECYVPWTGQSVWSGTRVHNKLQCREVRCLDGVLTGDRGTCRVANRRQCWEQCSGPYSTLPRACFDYCSRIDGVPTN